LTPKIASRLLFGFWLVALIIAIWHTFFEQKIVGALIGISSAFTMYYLLRNPQLLMAKTFDEFGDLYDESRDKKYLWGYPGYQAVMLAAVLYIFLV